jgi:ferritin-like metal-binding protein YciE
MTSAVSDHLAHELVTYLAQARELEQLDLRLLGQGMDTARDDRVRGIYRDHRAQTEEHLRLIDGRLAAYDDGAPATGARGSVGALEIALSEDALYTPTQLAISAYAFESLEIAVYHVLGHVAGRAGDARTATVVQQILEEEEEAAELLAGTFDRALAATLTLAGDGSAPERRPR